MIVFESKSVRQLVVRLERGDAVHEALERIAKECNIKAAWVTGLGAFESARVCEYDQDARNYRPAKSLDAAMEVLSLTGNLSLKDGEVFVHVHTALSREIGDRILVVGGHLLEANVFALELHITCFDDITLVRGVDSATGLSLWTDTENACVLGKKEDVVAAATSETNAAVIHASASPWDIAAQASELADKSPNAAQQRVLAEAKIEQEQDTLDKQYNRTPEVGSWIDHAKFGLCLVEKQIDEDTLVIKMPNARRTRIRLDYLRVMAPKRETTRVIYPVVSRKA